MAVTISDVSATLKKVIQPYVSSNLPSGNVVLSQMERDSDVTFMNDNFYVPVRSDYHGGIANLASDSSSTRSGSTPKVQANVGVKITTGQFDITQLTMDATRDAGAVVNELMDQADSMMPHMRRHLNRQVLGDGYGIIGEVQGSVGAGTAGIGVVTSSVDDTRGTADYFGSINGDIKPGEYIVKGMTLGIGTGGADAGTVSSVTFAAGSATVVMTGAPAIAANDAVYILDGSEAGAGTSELNGVIEALSYNTAGTYAGIARSSTPIWQPQTDSTSEALTLAKLESYFLKALRYGNDGDKYAIFVNATLFRKYADLLTAMRRTVNKTELVGGWSGLELEVGAGRVGVFLDYQVPDGEVLGLNLDTWKLCQVSDAAWMESPSGEGGSLLRLSNSIKHQATVYWFLNVICTAPAANFRLSQKTG